MGCAPRRWGIAWEEPVVVTHPVPASGRLFLPAVLPPFAIRHCSKACPPHSRLGPTAELARLPCPPPRRHGGPVAAKFVRDHLFKNLLGHAHFGRNPAKAVEDASQEGPGGGLWIEGRRWRARSAKEAGCSLQPTHYPHPPLLHPRQQGAAQQHPDLDAAPLFTPRTPSMPFNPRSTFPNRRRRTSSTWSWMRSTSGTTAEPPSQPCCWASG